ncbi:MAG: hypothetical protein KKA42_05745 [candidate division Zixibacteria bacterium]|nr:hypothetical protein [candidate division Zixibacteria bacterium]
MKSGISLIAVGALVVSLLLACSDANEVQKVDNPAVMSVGPMEQQLAAKRAEFAAGAPPEVLAAAKRGMEELHSAKIDAGALRVGEMMPAFELPDATERTVASSDLLATGPAVIVFYRGGW